MTEIHVEGAYYKCTSMTARAWSLDAGPGGDMNIYCRLHVPLSFRSTHLYSIPASTNPSQLFFFTPIYYSSRASSRMSSYVINGASTGIGVGQAQYSAWHNTSLIYSMGQFEFLRQLSLNPTNTVIGLVRNVKGVEAKAKTEIGRSNVHIIHGDLDSYEVLKAGLSGYPSPLFPGSITD